MRIVGLTEEIILLIDSVLRNGSSTEASKKMRLWHTKTKTDQRTC